MNKGQIKDKILIVDDDPINLDIIIEILGDEFNYKTASSGTEALNIAETFHADVILLDIMMPDIDGYEICKKFKKDKRLAFTKIILVSAKQMLEDRLKGYTSGADDYIIKPFEPSELLAKIRVFLRLKSIEEIERMKSNLISIFSHETKTPLHAILGFSELLLENKNLSQPDREALEHIKNCGKDMLDLVDKTILLSNLRDGSKIIKKTSLPLINILKYAVENIASILKSDKKTITIEDEKDILIEADKNLMLTAFSLLFKNACKYAKEDSTLKISIQNNINQTYSIIITTFGNVIPEDKLSNFFSEFMVNDVSRHGRETGLEMAIVKNIIELHKGSIDVIPDNESGKNLFIIRIQGEKIDSDKITDK